jgi:signal peptidase II
MFPGPSPPGGPSCPQSQARAAIIIEVVTGSRSRVLLVALALVAIIGCDRATKSLAVATLGDGERRSFLADTVRLQYVENHGAFLGLGRDLGERARFWVLLVGTGALLALAAATTFRSPARSAVEALAWAFLIGGGVSNLADRALREGAVVDFLNVGLGPVRTGIFNVADVGITAGTILLVAGAYLTRRNGPRPPTDP